MNRLLQIQINRPASHNPNPAKKGLGTWVEIDQSRRAMAEEAKGSIVCPWPHPGRFDKRVTTVRLDGSDRSISWSDLNIHLIAEHGFFEGRGSPFRLDPKQLVEIIFLIKKIRRPI